MPFTPKRKTDSFRFGQNHALDEVILKDRNRLVVLDYGGGMNLTDMKEAVDVFYQGQTE